MKHLLTFALLAAGCARAAEFNAVEATIPQIQAAVRQHRITYEQLVRLYLRRIEAYDRAGPKLNSIRHLNPKAIEIAKDRDRHRAGHHGLYGIPVLLKDNIDTVDEPTTAGSVALADSVPPRDAFITRKLREAGAVIIGKANLTEFANYLANNMPSGYSSLGGYVLNPYNIAPAANGDGRPELSPGGSSAGPGSAVAANLVAVAIGSETSGSILSPSNQNSIVGIKPTVGLISRTGVIPIAASQDTAGPMARTVTDAAILLGALTTRDPQDTATDHGELPSDYTEFLIRDGLKDARIGVPRAGFWDNLKDDQKKILGDAIAVMRTQGAEVIDVEIQSAKELNAFKSGVLRYEFKRELNHYLSTLKPGFPIRTLADVIAFNNKANALKYGQALAIASDATDLEADKAEYMADRAKDLRLSRDEGIDLVMRRHHLDALIFPSNSGASMPAKAGYPSVIVPGGYLADGAPFGVVFTGLAWSEPTLIRLAYSFEQATHYRRPPSSVPAR